MCRGIVAKESGLWRERAQEKQKEEDSRKAAEAQRISQRREMSKARRKQSGTKRNKAAADSTKSPRFAGTRCN